MRDIFQVFFLVGLIKGVFSRILNGTESQQTLPSKLRSSYRCPQVFSGSDRGPPRTSSGIFLHIHIQISWFKDQDGPEWY